MSILDATPGLKEKLIQEFIATQPRTGFLPTYHFRSFVDERHANIDMEVTENVYDEMAAKYAFHRFELPRVVLFSEWSVIERERWSGRIFRGFHALHFDNTCPYLFECEDDIVLFQMLFL